MKKITPQVIKEAIENCLDDIEKARYDSVENSKILNSKFTFNNITALVNYINDKGIK